MIRRTLFHAWRTLAFFLLLLALLVSLARVGLPWIQDQRQALLEWLISAPELDGSLGGLGVHWTDYGPAIALQELTLKNRAAQPWLVRVGEATLHLNIWQSLRQRQWVIDDLQFHHVLIHIPDRVRETDPASRAERDWQPLARLLLGSLQQFRLSDVQLSLHSQHGDISSLSLSSLRWQNQGDQHQGQGELLLGEAGMHSQLRLIADFRGPATDYRALSGQLYLATQSLVPAVPAEAPIDETGLLADSQLQFEGWLVRQDRQWQLGVVRFGENRLQWRQDGRNHLMALKGGLVQWQRLGSGWQVVTQDLAVQGDQLAWHPWSMQMDYQPGSMSGRIDPLNLSALTPALALLAGEHSLAGQALQQLKPSGLLTDLEFNRRDADGQWQLSGQLQDISWHRWQMLPGVHQLNGLFEANTDSGHVQFDVGAQKIQTGHYFQEPIPINHVSAALDWQRLDDGWQLNGQQIRLETPALTAQTDFRLTLPAEGSPALYLVGQIDLQDASQAWRYYPVPAMGADLTHYLTQSLQAGEAHGATILWDGPLDAFPYHQGEGIFQVKVPLRHGRFQFQPDWQPLEDLSLDLLFQNDTLEMRSDGARLGKVQASYIHAWFPTLEANSHLYINADVAGEAQAVSHYLNHSGVANSVGSALTELQLSKPVTGTLQLDIPLSGSNVKVLGQVDFADNNLQIASLSLPFERVNGSLFFTEQLTRFDDLHANLWGMPLTLNYLGQTSPDGYDVKLQLQGKLKSVASWPAIWQQTLAGESPWQGNLDLTLGSGGRYHYQARLNSDLAGLALNGPVPYQKQAKDKLPLQISIRGDQSQSQIRADWKNGLQFDGRLENKTKQWSRFWVSNQVDDQLATNPAPFRVELKQTELDADAWLAWWKAVSASLDPQTLDSSAAYLPSRQVWHLQAGKLLLGGETWEQANVTLNRDGQSWHGALNASQVAGKIERVHDDPWDIQISYLKWPDSADKDEAVAAVSPLAEQQKEVASWPAFNFTCQHCLYGEANLGEIRAEGRPQADGSYRVDPISIRQGNNELKAKAHWQVKNGEGVSALEATLDASSLESVLQGWGVSGGISGAKTHGELQLQWPGLLYEPHLINVRGQYSLKTGDGMLQQLNSPGTRILSVLSLNALVRRLSLDFSDVFGKGFFFKSIEAKGQLSDGLLHNDTLAVKGDAGDIEGSGSVNLVEQQLDYHLSFTPHLTGSMPLMAAFAVTPVTGLYVLAASTILSPFIEVITRVNFHVTGPLGDPHVVEEGREQGKIKPPFAAHEERK